MRGKRRKSGVLLVIAALIIMQLPVAEADAASSASDFKMEGSTLVKYRGTETNVSVPGTVEVIGRGAFEDNDTVELVVLPKSVKRIEAYAFWGCDRLEEVVLGKGLLEVGDFAFTNCKGLEEMTVPSNVHSIGIQAFADCVNMTDITIAPEVTQIHETAFDGCVKLLIHCEEGSVADKYAESFYKKQEDMPEYEGVPDEVLPEDSEEEKEDTDGTEIGRDPQEDSQDETENGQGNSPAGDSAQENENLLGMTHIVGNRAVVFVDNTSPVVLDGAAEKSAGTGSEEAEEQSASKQEVGTVYEEEASELSTTLKSMSAGPVGASAMPAGIGKYLKWTAGGILFFAGIFLILKKEKTI